MSAGGHIQEKKKARHSFSNSKTCNQSRSTEKLQPTKQKMKDTYKTENVLIKV